MIGINWTCNKMFLNTSGTGDCGAYENGKREQKENHLQTGGSHGGGDIVGVNVCVDSGDGGS